MPSKTTSIYIGGHLRCMTRTTPERSTSTRWREWCRWPDYWLVCRIFHDIIKIFTPTKNPDQSELCRNIPMSSKIAIQLKSISVNLLHAGRSRDWNRNPGKSYRQSSTMFQVISSLIHFLLLFYTPLHLPGGWTTAEMESYRRMSS